MFAGETRKQVLLDQPGTNFGEISKIVGTRWRNLPKATRDEYESRAKKLADEMMAKAKQEEKEKAAAETAAQLNDPQRSQSPWSDTGG